MFNMIPHLLVCISFISAYIFYAKFIQKKENEIAQYI